MLRIEIYDKDKTYNKKNNELTHFPSNLHLTAVGHEVVGETVGKYLYTLIENNEEK